MDGLLIDTYRLRKYTAEFGQIIKNLLDKYTKSPKELKASLSRVIYMLGNCAKEQHLICIKMCHRSNTFLISSPTYHSKEKEHLYFVITDPIKGEILIVGITSSFQEKDFILERGDHPYIRHKSYIDFGKAQLIHANVLKQQVEKHLVKREINARTEIIEKIAEGVLKSSRTSAIVKRFFENYNKNLMNNLG